MPKPSVTVCDLEISLHFGLTLNLRTVLSILTPIAAVDVLWLRVWKAHHDVYQVMQSTSLGEQNQDADNNARILVSLNALAYMLYTGFALALFAVGLSFLAITDVIGGLLRR